MQLLVLSGGENVKVDILGQIQRLTNPSQHLTSQSQILTNY
jgi:hypothetical protein